MIAIGFGVYCVSEAKCISNGAVQCNKVHVVYKELLSLCAISFQLKSPSSGLLDYLGALNATFARCYSYDETMMALINVSPLQETADYRPPSPHLNTLLKLHFN